MAAQGRPAVLPRKLPWVDCKRLIHLLAFANLSWALRVVDTEPEKHLSF